MADPLSIAATKLPGSSFDPVEFAADERKRLLNEQQARRTRYNELFDQVASVSGGNPWDEGLRNERNKIIEEGAGALAEGVDITDITNPQSGKQAAEFRGRISKLNNDAQMSKAIQDLVTNTRQILTKDAAVRGGQGAYDADATINNLQTLMSKRSIDDANKYLSEMGDNLLVAKPRYVDIPALIKKNLPSAKQTGGKVIEGGQEVTRKYEEYSPQELRTMFSSMLNDPDTVRTVKRDKEADVTSMNESDLDYLMRTYGNQLARKQTFEFKEPYVPKTTSEKKEKEKSVEPVSEPETLSIVDGKSGETYTVKGENTFTYDQSKTPKLKLGEGVIDVNSGKRIPAKDFVSLTPISSSEYYVSMEKSLFETTSKGKPGRLTDTPDKNAKKQRFVLGVYTEGSGDTQVKKTVLVPYDNIKNTLDKVYGVEGGLLESKNESSLSTEDQQAYDWVSKNPNDPRAKQILKYLNKK